MLKFFVEVKSLFLLQPKFFGRCGYWALDFLDAGVILKESFINRPFPSLNQRNKPGKEEFHNEFLARIVSYPVETKETNRENNNFMINSRHES